MERIRLSDHFHYRKLLRFVTPSIAMMVFISIYSIVDGFFVSNFAGDVPFAALNLIYPLIMILGAVGFMLCAGGNAVVSKTLGEGKREEANRIFSMLIYATIIIGVILSIIGLIILRPIAETFAKQEKKYTAEERAQLVEYCVTYGRILLLSLPMFMTQNAFQGFFITAEKPRLGLFITIGAGVGNGIFDAIFVAGLDMGLQGAALATAINQCAGGIIPLFYFFRKNDSLLRLCKTKFYGKIFGAVCVNGLSELITNISLSVVSILYNMQLMDCIGIDGVSAYGIMMYVGFIFIAVFLGYALGSSPIIGYHYGAGNRRELKSIFKKSAVLLCIFAVAMTAVSIVFAGELSGLFAKKGSAVWLITKRGFRIYALSFLICGLNIFASSFFTALSNGGISLLLSFFRTFLCQAFFVMLLPRFWGLNGIWAASVVAECVSLLLSEFMILKNKKRYGYL
jgi:putative MATE family efflux protein